MKFVFLFALLAVAFAAEVEVQPVVLPEAPAPFVAPGQYGDVFIADLAEEPAVLDDAAAPLEAVKIAAPEIAEDIVAHEEWSVRFVDNVADVAEDAPQQLDDAIIPDVAEESDRVRFAETAEEAVVVPVMVRRPQISEDVQLFAAVAHADVVEDVPQQQDDAVIPDVEQISHGVRFADTVEEAVVEPVLVRQPEDVQVAAEVAPAEEVVAPLDDAIIPDPAEEADRDVVSDPAQEDEVVQYLRKFQENPSMR